MADRNFLTLELLQGVEHRQAAFLIRHHAALHLEHISPRESAGRCSTGSLWQYDVRLSNGLVCRAIEIVRDQASRGGTRRVILLTNVRGYRASARNPAELYLERWTTREAFRQITQDLSCEVRTLGYPRAALLAFTLAVMAYNCLACVCGALASAHGQEQVESHLSGYYLALEVKTASDGMQVAVPAQEWEPWENLPPKRLAHVLRIIASHARFRRYAKSSPGPKSELHGREGRRSALGTIQLQAHDPHSDLEFQCGRRAAARVLAACGRAERSSKPMRQFALTPPRAMQQAVPEAAPIACVRLQPSPCRVRCDGWLKSPSRRPLQANSQACR